MEIKIHVGKKVGTQVTRKKKTKTRPRLKRVCKKRGVTNGSKNS